MHCLGLGRGLRHECGILGVAGRSVAFRCLRVVNPVTGHVLRQNKTYILLIHIYKNISFFSLQFLFVVNASIFFAELTSSNTISPSSPIKSGNKCIAHTVGLRSGSIEQIAQEQFFNTESYYFQIFVGTKNIYFQLTNRNSYPAERNSFTDDRQERTDIQLDVQQTIYSFQVQHKVHVKCVCKIPVSLYMSPKIIVHIRTNTHTHKPIFLVRLGDRRRCFTTQIPFCELIWLKQILRTYTYFTENPV